MNPIIGVKDHFSPIVRANKKIKKNLAALQQNQAKKKTAQDIYYRRNYERNPLPNDYRPPVHQRLGLGPRKDKYAFKKTGRVKILGTDVAKILPKRFKNMKGDLRKKTFSVQPRISRIKMENNLNNKRNTFENNLQTNNIQIRVKNIPKNIMDLNRHRILLNPAVQQMIYALQKENSTNIIFTDLAGVTPHVTKYTLNHRFSNLV